MDAQHTLEPTANVKTSTSKPVKQGLMINSPYTDFNIKKVFYSAPEPGSSKNGEASFFTCKVSYEYTLPDGSTKRGQIKLGYPVEPGKRARSRRGITEILKFYNVSELKELKKNPDFVHEGTGKFAITATLPGGVDTTLAYCNVWRQIYAKGVHHMYAHGSKGTKMLGKEISYAVPAGELGPENTSDLLRYPLIHAEKTVHDTKGNESKEFDPKGDVRLRMDVFKSVKIKDIDGNDRVWEDLKGLGIEHAPTVRIDDLYIGAKSKFRVSMFETVTTEDLPPSMFESEDTLKQVQAYRANPAAHLDDAQKGFGGTDDGFGDSNTGEGETGGDQGEDFGEAEQEAEERFPDPIPTPAVTPLSPAKTATPARRPQVATRAPAGSPRAQRPVDK